MKLHALKHDNYIKKQVVFLISISMILSGIIIMSTSGNALPPPNSPPFGDITSISPNPASCGQTVSFTGWAKDPENGTLWLAWDFGDGNTQVDNGVGWPYWSYVSHSYGMPCTYKVWFNMTDMGGKTCNEYDFVTITNDNPNTPSTPTGPTNLAVDETGTYSTSATDPDGHQVQYRFDWDADGSHDYSSWTSFGASGHTGYKSHSWSTPGTYTVKAQAKDYYGAESGWSTGLTVTINRQPNTPSTPTGPTNLDEDESGVYETSATDPDDDQVQYRFDWDADGSHDYSSWTTLGASGHTGSMQHSWSNAGTYVVKSQAKDEYGAESGWSDGLTVTVNQQPNTPSTPSGPITRDVDQPGTYDTSATDPNGDQVQYRFDWDASGGHDYSSWTSLGPSGHTGSMSHSWTSAGTYVVKSQAKDEYGAESSWSNGLTVNIIANEPPVADANGPYYGNVGDTITFDGSGSSDSDGTIIDYDWDFGDGNYGNGETTTHIYTSGGTFTVILAVEDDDGATDTDTTYAYINEYPVADAGSSKYGKPGQSIQFDGSGSNDPDGNIVSYEWNFGDGHTGSGMKPNHVYQNKGTYTVTLTVEDDDGATDTDTTKAYISEPNEPPTVEITYPEEGSLISGEILIEGTADDPNGEETILRVLIQIDEDEWITAYGTSYWAYSWDTNIVEDGIHTISVKCYDNSYVYSEIVTISFEVKNHYEPGEPNLECDGTLNWEKIKPGSTVTGSIIVRNIGDETSTLNWEILEYPEWGTWTFTPPSGEDLSPADGDITIEITVEAPNKKESSFNGEIKIINSDNTDDYEIITSSLVTPKIKTIPLIFTKIFQRYPLIMRLLSLIL